MKPLDSMLVRRSFVSADLALIVDSWVASYADAVCRCRHLRGQDRADFTSGVRARVIATVSDPAAEIVVIAARDDPGLVVAWACIRRACVEYVYTKRSYRRLGLASMLVYGCTSIACVTPQTALVPALARLQIRRAGEHRHGPIEETAGHSESDSDSEEQ